MESLDHEQLHFRDTSGRRVRIDRAQVQIIRLTPTAADDPYLKVELRPVSANDSMDVSLNGEFLWEDVRGSKAWLDITDQIKTGNNELRLRIHNDRASWSYHLSLRVNGVVTSLRCGEPLRSIPCRCCGMNGDETGVLNDLPSFWLHADRAQGTVELLP